MSDKIVVTKQDVEIFRTWLSKQPHLPQDEEDHLIKAFIVGAKGSVQKAKSVYEHFFGCAQTMPELFAECDPLCDRLEKFREILGFATINTDDGLLVVSKVFDTDPTHFDVTDYFCRQFLNVLVHLWDNNAGGSKATYFMDCSGMNIGHMRTVTPLLAEKLMSCVVGGAPIRIKAVHLLNVPSILNLVMNLFIHLLPEKTRKRVQLHTDLESVQAAIPVKFLPEEYGGDLPPTSKLTEKNLDLMRKYRTRLLAQPAKRAAEAKMRPKNRDVVATEMTGTFRKLTLD